MPDSQIPVTEGSGEETMDHQPLIVEEIEVLTSDRNKVFQEAKAWPSWKNIVALVRCVLF